MIGADAIAASFVEGPLECTPVPGGHINASWRVQAASGTWFLQRINPVVFPDPRAVATNAWHVTEHLASLGTPGVAVPRLVAARDGSRFVEDEDGGVWRCQEFVTGRVTAVPEAAADAREAARAFGAFARALASYRGPGIREVIPGFHDTVARVAALERAMDRDVAGRARACRGEILGILGRSELADELSSRLASGALPTRLAHNDAKIANVVFDAATGRARWVVDLDTVMPGTILFDFGDLVRSTVSHAPEDGGTTMEADPDLFEALAEGFSAGVGDAMTPAELELLEVAGRVITFEQAVRFLTDHLEGDRYYRVVSEEQNLWRARTQLTLLASLERNAARFDEVVRRLAGD